MTVNDMGTPGEVPHESLSWMDALTTPVHMYVDIGPDTPLPQRINCGMIIPSVNSANHIVAAIMCAAQHAGIGGASAICTDGAYENSAPVVLIDLPGYAPIIAPLRTDTSTDRDA